MSATERVAIDDASDGLRLVAGNEPAALVYHVPGAQLPSGEAVTVTAHVSASTAVELTAFRGSSVTRGRSSAPGRWEAIELTVPPQARGGLEVRIEAPRQGEVILSGVNLTFGTGVLALLGPDAAQVAAGEGRTPLSPASPASPVSPPASPPPLRSESASPALTSSGATAPVTATGPSTALAPVLTHRGFRLLFGRGAEFAAWNQVFFGSTSGFFSTATYSDTKYLEFAQQFGFVGMLLLVLLAAVSIGGSWRLARSLPDGHARTLVVGLTGVVLIGFAALLHLLSLFRVGFGTAVFMAMALLATKALMESRRR
jgi:hypothetical protein